MLHFWMGWREQLVSYKDAIARKLSDSSDHVGQIEGLKEELQCVQAITAQLIEVLFEKNVIGPDDLARIIDERKFTDVP